MQLFLFVLVICVLTSRSEPIRFEERSKAPSYADPDRHGYRMCASWQLADGTPIFSGCDPYTINRCGEELKFNYQCCSGFEHANERLGGSSANPCGKMIPQFDNCPSVVEELGFKKFALYLKNISELTRKNGSPFTIFVPMPEDGRELDSIYGGNSREVGYHVVKGRIYADSLRSGTKLQSIYKNQELEVYRSSSGVVSVECSEISRADIECQAGLIHIIRSPLKPRSGLGSLDKTSVMSLLRSNPDTREFANDLPQELQKSLSDINSGSRFTVLAPSAQSWSTAKSGKSKDVIEKLAASHVTNGLKCSGAITKSSQTFVDTEGEKFDVQCEIKNRDEVRQVIDVCGKPHTFVNGKTDQTAANGVVHLLDSPIISSADLTVKDFMENPECAKHLNIDKFVDVLKECDLHMEEGTAYAIIAPENEAFDWWKNYAQFKPEYERFQRDAEYRCRVARYHIVKQNGNLRDIPKFSGQTDGHRSNNKRNYLYETTYITKNSMGPKFNFHYSTVNNFDTVPLKDTSIFRTSRINVIPEMNITDVVSSQPDLSESKKIMDLSNIEETTFKKNAPKNLFLVSTNEGWLDPRSKILGKNLLSPDLARFAATSSAAANFAKLHHVPLYLWGGDIGYFDKNSVHKFMSSAGVELTFWNDNNGVMRIGHNGFPKEEWPRVVKTNQHARDGMVWTLDGYMKCPESICPLQLEDVDVFTFYTAACLTAELPGEENAKDNFSTQPTVIAGRHPELCIVIKQGEVETKKEIFEGGEETGHEDHAAPS